MEAVREIAMAIEGQLDALLVRRRVRADRRKPASSASRFVFSPIRRSLLFQFSKAERFTGIEIESRWSRLLQMVPLFARGNPPPGTSRAIDLWG